MGRPFRANRRMRYGPGSSWKRLTVASSMGAEQQLRSRLLPSTNGCNLPFGSLQLQRCPYLGGAGRVAQKRLHARRGTTAGSGYLLDLSRQQPAQLEQTIELRIAGRNRRRVGAYLLAHRSAQRFQRSAQGQPFSGGAHCGFIAWRPSTSNASRKTGHTRPRASSMCRTQHPIRSIMRDTGTEEHSCHRIISDTSHRPHRRSPLALALSPLSSRSKAPFI